MTLKFALALVGQGILSVQLAALEFVPNRGQLAPEELFLGRAANYSVLLASDGSLSYRTRGAAGNSTEFLKMELAGGHCPHAEGHGPLASRTSIYAGRNPSSWIVDIPHFSEVRCAEVYKGVDAIYRSEGAELEYRFHISPGADPGEIRMRFAAAEISLDGDGNLLLQTPMGQVRHKRPFAYQQSGGKQVTVRAAFLVFGDQVKLVLGPYRRDLPLVVDPVVTYSSYLGGSGWDASYAVAADAAGNIYVAGETASGDFPGTSGIAGTIRPARAVLIAKIAASGGLAYTTILSSGGNDSARGIAIGVDGSVFVVGTVSGAQFPTTAGAFQPAFAGQQDAFIAKLDQTGHLQNATYLGGGSADMAYGVTVDQTGVYVTGATASQSFPTSANAPQRSYQGGAYDAFIAKFDLSCKSLLYSTLMGGQGTDIGSGIGIDAAGNAFIAGYTDSPNLPVRSAFQAGYGGSGDAFVASLNPAGSGWNFVTYLGGMQVDQANGIAVDAAGHSYVTGITFSVNFPVSTGAYQRQVRGAYDAFICKLDGAGNQVYTTLLGGSGTDSATAIAVTPAGKAVVTGYTQSTDFPLASPYQATLRGSVNSFVSMLSAEGTGLEFSTYLGGTVDDRGLGIAVYGDRTAVVTGFTASPDFPVTAGAVQVTPSAGYNGFLTQLQLPLSCPVSTSPSVLNVADGLTNALLNVTANSSCAWTASSNVPWVNFQVDSRGQSSPTLNSTGNGVLNIQILRNTSSQARSGTFVINGSVVTINQAGSTGSDNQPCPVSASPSVLNVADGPTNALLNVTANSSCAWTASSNVPWVNFQVDSLGQASPTLNSTGNGALNIQILRNTSSQARQGTLVVNGNVLTISQAGSTDATNVRYIYVIFNNFLVREPGAAGINFFLPLLNSGQLTRTLMAYNMFTTAAPEFNAIERFVIGLYYGILGRDPDYFGWDFHRRNLHLGVVTQDTLVTQFLATPEFINKYGPLTNAQFVTLIYQNALSRTPTAPDLSMWTTGLANGTWTRTQVVQAILNSNEFVTGASNRQTVFLLHATMLSREPGDVGYSAWLGYLNSPGSSLYAAVNAFVVSPEFQAKLGPT